MTEDKMMRLSLVAKQIGVGTSTIVQKLSVQGHKVENNPNAKLNFEQLKIVAKEFGANDLLQEASAVAPTPKVAVEDNFVPNKRQDDDYLPLYSRDSSKNQPVAKPAEPIETPKSTEPEKISAKSDVQFKVVGKVELDAKGNVIPPKPAVVEPAVKGNTKTS
jgi:translation initiation factor IF-2